MTTLQPVWVLRAELGDVNFEHGSCRLFIDRTGVYCPELEYITPKGDDDADGFEVTRVLIEPCENESEWFFSMLNSVANYCGVDRIDLANCLLVREVSGVQAWPESEDVVRRARAYQDLVSYHGMENFDSYPTTLTFDEAEARHDAQTKADQSTLEGWLATTE